MKTDPRKGRIISGAAILAALVVFFVTFSAEAATRLPPYRSSGVIPGTSLSYEKLAINNRGEVTITIVNPTNNGVSFSANFSFFNNNDRYLTGFFVEGFAAANRNLVLSAQVDDLRAYRSAVMMRVLGRSGRTARAPATGDAGS